jgi:hypothetical protein
MIKTHLLTNLSIIMLFLLSHNALLFCTHNFKNRSPSNKPLTLKDIVKKNIQIITYENGYRGIFAKEDIKVC